MAGRKVFTSGEILTASDVNSFLMDQSVMVFADSSARSSAIPSPSEGMVTYREDANRVEVFDGSSFGAIGGILQVVSTTKTDTFSASLGTGATTTVTDLNATITPSSTASKILVTVTVSLSINSTSNGVHAVLERNGSPVSIADAAGSRQRATLGSGASSSASVNSVAMSVLDSPASTSAQTYSLDLSHSGGAALTVYVNRSSSDSDTIEFGRYVSAITLMEVAV